MSEFHYISRKQSCVHQNQTGPAIGNMLEIAYILVARALSGVAFCG